MDSSDPLSRQEALRQASVYASGVLAMQDDPELRNIAGRAAALLDCPIAAISILDRDRQWFPAAIGLAIDQTPRDLSFCVFAIAEPGRAMCVPDATLDSRFVANALVTSAPFIRFYIGAPLVTSGGAALGALFLIDTTPRPPPGDAQQAALLDLAGEAVAEIERADNLRRFGAGAIEHIVGQIRDAARRDDETLLLALDRILRAVERKCLD